MMLSVCNCVLQSSSTAAGADPTAAWCYHFASAELIQRYIYHYSLCKCMLHCCSTKAPLEEAVLPEQCCMMVSLCNSASVPYFEIQQSVHCCMILSVHCYSTLHGVRGGMLWWYLCTGGDNAEQVLKKCGIRYFHMSPKFYSTFRRERGYRH